MPSICQSKEMLSWAARHRWAAAWSATLLISGCAPLPPAPSVDGAGVSKASTVVAPPAVAARPAPSAQSANARSSRWGWWLNERQGVEAAAKAAPPSAKPIDKPAPEAPADDTVDARDSDQRGLASWYGPGFHGRLTASGERFDSGDLTAAHRSLAFGTRVCVRSSVTGKMVVVRINDRGPFAKNRVIDLSQAAAKELGMVGLGIKPVELWALANDEGRCPGDDVDADEDPMIAGLNEGARRALHQHRHGAVAEAPKAKAQASRVSANKK